MVDTFDLPETPTEIAVVDGEPEAPATAEADGHEGHEGHDH